MAPVSIRKSVGLPPTLRVTRGSLGALGALTSSVYLLNQDRDGARSGPCSGSLQAVLLPVSFFFAISTLVPAEWGPRPP